MGFEFTGHVLRAPQQAPGNAATSSDTLNGVVRDVHIPPGTRTAPAPEVVGLPGTPAMVDLSGDHYRTSVLQAPGTTPQEYLVWVANTSQLALADDPTWWTSLGSGRPSVGTVVVQDLLEPTVPHTDGTLRVVVTDDGGKEIGTITHLVVARGDKTYSDGGWVDIEDPTQGRKGSAPYEVVVLAVTDQNGASGLVTLTDDNIFVAPGSAPRNLVQGSLTTLGGGLSLERGDAIVGVRYTVAPLKFWWTRNDRYETRFGWNDKLQRWTPYKGSAPANLGQLLFDTTYTLTPRMRTLPLGAILTGDGATLDEYAMVRLGTDPGFLSLPVGTNDPDGFIGIEVVTDADAEEYDFSGSLLAGVVGQNSGTLKFNPLYIQKHAGNTVWYINNNFSAVADGILGPLLGSDLVPLFLAPIPGPTDHPFIRIANRSPLAVTLMETETALEAALDPGEGSCLVALTTGRVRLSTADIYKAEPKRPLEFNKLYLGAQVIYSGVALNSLAQPTKAPVALVQADGTTTALPPTDPMFLPLAKMWPEDVEGTAQEPYMGLGVSGVLVLPDGNGAVPTPENVNPSGVAIPVRPGGDSFPSPQTLGLVRTIHDGVGDSILFSRDGAITELVVVDRLSELPPFPFRVPGGKAFIAKEATTLPVVGEASQVQIGSAERKLFAGKEVYFLQATMTPATFTTQARIYSRNRTIFRFDGDEVFYFSIDGITCDWHASSLPLQDFYTPEEVAASLQARITFLGGTGNASAVGGRVVLEAVDAFAGVVEIGWGLTRDLSGCAALGFLPGWRAVAGKPNWLADSGVSIGFSRSLLNLDRSKADADYRARTRLEDVVLSESITASPFTFLDFVPVEDVAGFDEGVFFNLQSFALEGDAIRIIDKRLEHFGDIEYRFPEGKFAWLEEHLSSKPVQVPTSSLALGRSGVVPESLLGAPGIGGGLFVASEGGRYIVQEQGVDYLMPDDGLPGVAQLVTRHGARVLFGAQGTFVLGGTTFTDLSTNFLADSTDPDIDPTTGLQRIDGSGDLVWLPVLRAGFRIKVASGDAAGSYLVTEVTDGTHCEVTPPFVASTERATPWEAFSGIPTSLYDPAIVADVVYKPFDHMPEEPFQVRVLSPLGPITDAGLGNFSAFVEEAVSKGRLISLRFGPVHPGAGVEAVLTALTLTDIGVVANNRLVLPWTTHVSEAAFQIQVGTELFVPVPVVSFSNDPAGVEYLTADWNDGTVIHPRGELKFAALVLTDLESSQVVLVETLRAANNLSAGQAEYDPKTGAIHISDADVLTHAGKTLYFVEQMITTEATRDVFVAPMVGAVSFFKPVSPGALVEMTYWLADSEGRRVGTQADTITEFLPVFVRREEAVRLTDSTFELDPLGLQVWATKIEPIVYIGPTQQNFGKIDFTVDRPGHLLGARMTFDRKLPAWVTPVATYAVYNAQGGERSYSTSQRPVYRPPFYIKAGKDNFGLRGNRVADFALGQMLRFGAECFYITQLRYFAPSDVTRVDIYPPTVLEVGSRSPGNDVLAMVTSVPITALLFPDGVTPVVTTAKAGFMQPIPTADFPFEPVNAKQNSMIFRGNLTAFAVPGHVMEISGVPFTVAQVTLNEDGTRTTVTFTSAFQSAIDPRGNPTIKLSYRPVYPPEVREFRGKGPLLPSEGVELTLFGEVEDGVVQPGRSLASGTEYSLDSATGVVQLLPPMQAPLGPEQWLLLSYTQMRVLGPFYENGSVAFPRWAAGFKWNTLPSEDNGFLGGRLTATYTFDNPDSFYFRALPLRSYMPEALKQALDEMKRWQSPSSGPRLTVAAPNNNWDFGLLGLLSQRRDLLDKDRAARTFLGFYNDTILAFEQVEETITGEFIGDRDGKFRFWVGKGLEYAPPGYEDDITGNLNPTNVWAVVFNQGDATRDLVFLAGIDPLVVPNSCLLADLVLYGEPLGTATLARLMGRQAALIRNDVDDIVLLGASQPKVVVTHAAPWYTVEIGGNFSRMGLPHKFSRLYPTTAGVFFTLQPGIGADVATGDVGVYAYKRTNPNSGEAESTHNKQIGQLANPVLGAIADTSSSTLRPRQARSRIWGYFPNGLPVSAFGTAINKPCMVLSAVPLSQTPIDPATGYPDSTQFLSQAPFLGSTPDTEAGDPELALPGFRSGDKIALGKPDGRLLEAVYPEEIDLFGNKLYTPVFVDEVLYGCVLTFKDRTGASITSPSKVLVATSPNAGTPAHEFPIGRADTIYVVPPDAENPISDPATESPTVAMQQQAAQTSPAYRQGFDLMVRTTGEVVDLSLPSWQDPFLFPIKEMQGQKSPIPMSHIEGEVEFANIHQVPLNTPALLGNAQDDSGDYQIPYRKGTATELDRFDEIGNLLGGLMARDIVLGGYYPDEILFEGESLGAPAAWKEPSALLTTVDVLPAPDYGTTPGRPGDFVLVEVDPSNPTGWQGLLSVGAIRSTGTESLIEPPRFVTQTSKGSTLRYDLKNYAVHTTPGNYPVNPQVTNPAGVRLFESTALGAEKVVISLQDTPLVLNDGVTVGVGNLNTILAANPANVLQVKIIGRPDDTYVNAPAGAVSVANSKDGRVLLTINITSATVECVDFQGNTTGVLAHNGVITGDFDLITGEVAPGPVTDHRHIIIDTTTTGGVVIPFLPAAGTPAQWFLPHVVAGTLKSCIYGWEYALDVDCTAGGSTSAFIDTDRLTFHEALDLEIKSRPRGFLHSNGVGADYTYQTELRVTEVLLGTVVLSTVNDVTGGYLSFLNRTDGASLFAGGTWTGAASPNEDGTLRVMAFEDVNAPILTSGITAAVQASQNEDPSGGDILVADGEASYNRIARKGAGPDLDVTRVQKGDVVYIDRSDTGLPDAATEKAGTYIVRHAVQADAGLPEKAVSVSAPLGSGGGFITTPFPRCLGLDTSGAPHLLTVDDSSMLPAAGRVFIMVNRANLDSPTLDTFKRALVSAPFVLNAGVLEIAAGTYIWADGTAAPLGELPISQIPGLLASWVDVAGLMALSVEVRGGELPDDSSVVGLHNPGVATFGFNALTYENFGATSVVAAAIVVGAPAAGEVRVDPAPIWTNEVFDTTGDAVVYDQVPGMLTVRISAAQGSLINNPQGHPIAPGPGVTCLLPGTEVRTEDGAGVAGFFALGGVFVEPSTPQQALPLGGIDPKVVDNARSLNAADVGMRSFATPEDVHFEVRRVRRWHGQQNALNDAVFPLRFAYEVRRGTIATYTRNLSQVGLVGTLAGTTVGSLFDEDVNINPGDIFRVLDTDGTVLDQGVVDEVTSPIDLKLAAPGLTMLEVDTLGKTFEVYLRRAPVPHEQSNEQLLDLITDRVVYETKADRTDPDPANWTGGYVPAVPDGTGSWADISNLLYDDSALPPNFVTLGVKLGDIVVIDPAGNLEVAPATFERGFRPLGDRSVPTRTPAGAYLAGATSDLDDNRGFYRVLVVHEDHLEVDPIHTFAGGLGTDVILGGTKTNLAYAVYPTVSTSVLCVEGAEGQNDLRPTRAAVGGTYQSGDPVEDAHSLRPFSYRIIRPTSMFSNEVIDTVLMMRERMLSLIEMLGSVTSGARGGYYWDWQEEEHIEDLGTLTDPESGLGLFPNRLVVGLLGETARSPFCNNTTCLSLLDRRFWIHDAKLDSKAPDPNNDYGMIAAGAIAFDQVGGPYTAYNDITVTGGSEVRPVLTDHLDLILDVRDRLRAIRYTWLTYRTHRFRGTLTAIDQFEAEYPRRLADRQRALLLEASVDKVVT